MECKFKFNDYDVWNLITDTFCYLPISALLNDKNLLLHGGLSPRLELLNQINKINSIFIRILGTLV